MKRIFYIITTAILILSGSYLFAQSYPQDYFRDPLGIPIQLAANFGELRPNHFHMGLDIRTQSRENLPVYAPADGFIAHIKIEKYGYGRAIYIKHPAGYTTVYGHLNSFFPALEKYLKDKQYQDEQWEQNFDLPENLFPVKKGQFIAFSGNTGGSAGPHLHFEIRDSKTGNNLNPLLFGLNVPDHIAPILYGLYWYDRRYSVYTAQPQPIALIKKNGVFTSNVPVVKTGSPLITLGVRMEDMNNVSPFKFGVYHAAMYMDGALKFEFKINNFSYDSTRYVNACMDYSKWMKSKQGIQYLSILPGNKLKIFTPTGGDGTLRLNDSSVHDIRIELSDEKNNITVIAFKLQYVLALGKDYTIPNNAIVCDVHEPNNITTANSKIAFDENAFYDALPLVVYETASTSTRQLSPTIHVGDYTVPVHDYYNIAVKPAIISNDKKDKIVMELKSGTSTKVIAGLWKDGWLTGNFNKLDDVRLLLDTIAPKAEAVGWNNGAVIKSKILTLKCTDDLGDIETFKALLDGKWLMFAKKNDYFIYTFDEHCLPGKHELTIIATDAANNTSMQTFNFIK
ncbi:MAG: M23 family metallopeptidase [Bacteroidetes bacterium]|nr:M23 family metallopeptidase [Bacteroidota bacterium]